MNPNIFLFMVAVGIILFYVGQESLARIEFTWQTRPYIVSVWLGGLMLMLFGLFGAYNRAMDSLYLVFPEHLIRIWRGVNKSLTKFTTTKAGKEKKEDGY